MKTDWLEKRLFILAAAFLWLYALILTLSPSVRENSWNVSYRLSHWFGIIGWSVTFFIGRRFVARHLPNRDPYILPIGALLSGWGILTIWRLDPNFGVRQSAWLIGSVLALVILTYKSVYLALFRRHKYVLLAAGLSLTGLTLILGTSPTGIGPRLWLGCCGLYFQPSEPLKLLLVLYLAAYLADRSLVRNRIFPMLLPTIFVTGLALMLLLIQRDIGTASIFILLHTVILYVATGRRRVLLATVIGLILASLTGILLVDVVSARLESWLDPWKDPSGRSYQIIQALLSIANGGVLGRGPGLGSPSLVPVAHSDFIYAAIAEETGLLGSLGFLILYALLLTRGFIIALQSTSVFHRLLAFGLTAYLGIQSLLIICGDLRLLPLTGVTLPFVSYGGSSLLTSFVGAALLIRISNQTDREPAPLLEPRPYLAVSLLLGVSIAVAAFTQFWWVVVRGPDLLARTDNPRRSIADRFVRRGSLVDRNDRSINVTVGTNGSLRRVYLYPELSSITGYTHNTFGQAGLEASLDDYLRGLQGNPASKLWWHQLLYGTPPPGLNVRLSLDIALQIQADKLMENVKGAVVLINAHSGEILVMASHPTFDPNELDRFGVMLNSDQDAPLLNRAAQGSYSPGDAVAPLITGYAASVGKGTDVDQLFRDLGFYSQPRVRMPVALLNPQASPKTVLISPLHMAVAAATLSNGGVRPAPRIALAVDTPRQGWIILPALEESSAVLSKEAANTTAFDLAVPLGAYWEWIGQANSKAGTVTWYIAGTLPNWQGAPLSLAVLVETEDTATARRVGEGIMQSVMGN